MTPFTTALNSDPKLAADVLEIARATAVLPAGKRSELLRLADVFQKETGTMPSRSDLKAAIRRTAETLDTAHVHRLTEYAASLTAPAPAPGFHEYLNARRPGDWRRRRSAVLQRFARRTP